jgi:hypothetical protein
MMLLENVTDERDHRQLHMTHAVKTSGARNHPEHTLRFYVPEPGKGQFAGRLEFAVVLSADQARELKAHL